MVLRIFSYPLIILFLVLTALQVPHVVGDAYMMWKMYTPLIGGTVGYFLLSLLPFISKNKEHMMTFSHEMTHWVTSLMFFHKLHSFQVGEDVGSITHSGGRIGDLFIGLSPYCFPLFTLMLLFLRFMIIPDYLWGYDIFLGLTLGFHIACFCNHTGTYQSDIRERGIFRSYLFIVAFWLFFVILILVGIKSNMFLAIKSIFIGYWESLVDFAQIVRGWIQ